MSQQPDGFLFVCRTARGQAKRGGNIAMCWWDASPYAVDRTQDEHGEDRWFLADSNGDWIGEPFPTRELASEEVARRNARYEN